MKRLAVCVDDFGLYDGVDEAALWLADAGRVNAISCQVAGPAWRRGAPRLASLSGAAVDLGLHLDLTECTVDRAVRRPLGRLIVAAYTGGLDPRSMRREIDAQLDAFEAGLGRAPAHVDGHCHVHQLPCIREQLVDALDRRYAVARPWLRISRPSRRLALKPHLIGLLGSRGLRTLAEKHGYRHSGRLLGVYDFNGDVRHYERLMAKWIAEAREGDLLMCHPALGKPTGGDPIGEARVREFGVLAGAAFVDALATSDATLAPLSRILAGAA